MPRKALSVDVKKTVLHEAGYKCSNPVCRHILTLDIHHLVLVAKDGSNTAENLIALCPNCHSLHHKGEIPEESLRAWKQLLLSLNEAYDRRSIDLLLALDKLGNLFVSGDGVLECAPLIASDLVKRTSYNILGKPTPEYSVQLTDKGNALIEAWKNGDQEKAVSSLSASN